MNKSARLLLLSCLAAVAFGAGAQDVPPVPPAGAPDGRGPVPGPWRDLSAAERERWREERRDAWRRMSPEERRQLRHDIREAGRQLYPRRPRHGRVD